MAGLELGLLFGAIAVSAVLIGAGTLNVTRHGLDTGRQQHIDQPSHHVRIQEYCDAHIEDGASST